MSKPTTSVKVVKSYCGSGELYLPTNSKVNCAVKMDQLSTGRIVAICQVHQKDLHRLNCFDRVNKLQGNTDDGWNFKLEHPMVVEDRLKIKSRTSRTLTVIGRQLTVSKKRLPRTDLVVRFTIANLTLEEKLLVKVSGTNVKLERLSGYDVVINHLKGSRGVDVTCQATANLSAFERRDNLIRIMDDLCLLLTLAREHGLLGLAIRS